MISKRSHKKHPFFSKKKLGIDLDCEFGDFSPKFA